MKDVGYDIISWEIERDSLKGGSISGSPKKGSEELNTDFDGI